MNLRVLLPQRVFLDQPVHQVVAEGLHGSFGLLPRHVDFVSPLVPGILSYVDEKTDEEHFLATGEGLLVKRGPEVSVSIRSAVAGDDLGKLEEAVRRSLTTRNVRERRARRAVARLEADMVRRFVELHEEVPRR